MILTNYTIKFHAAPFPIKYSFKNVIVTLPAFITETKMQSYQNVNDGCSFKTAVGKAGSFFKADLVLSSLKMETNENFLQIL